MGIPRFGILEREAAEHVDEGLGVTTQTIGPAGETVEANERLLVILRRDGFFDVVGLLEASGKIESEGDPEKIFGRERIFLVEQNIGRDGSADEAAEAIEDINRGRVDFGSGGMREETLDDGFGLLLEADVEEGEGFLDTRGNFVLAHDLIGKNGCLGSWWL